MNKFKIEMKSAQYILVMSILFIALGYMLSYPLPYSLEHVSRKLVMLQENWWRLALVTLLFGVTSVIAHKKNPIISEWLGILAMFSLLYPLLSLYAGIPKDLGWTGILFLFGGLFFICSLSAVMALTFIGIISKLMNTASASSLE